MKITSIKAREIFDARGLPTIECRLFLSDGSSYVSSVPSGASKGSSEALELRDGGSRLMGMGVYKAIRNIEEVIFPAIIGNRLDAIELDKKMIALDGSEDKSKLGANSILAVSLSLFRAHAAIEGMELYEFIACCMNEDTVSMPHPLFNFINGGMHADNNLKIQEYLMIPIKASSFRSALESSVVVFYKLKEILKKNNKRTLTGDEGGFASMFNDDLEPFKYVMEAIDSSNFKEEVDFLLGVDVAASCFYDNKLQKYNFLGKNLNSEQMISFYRNITEEYPIYYLEDGLYENDWDGWSLLNKRLGEKVQIVGDDIFTTNIHRIEKGMKSRCANSVLIKPNQIGTITETLEVIRLAKLNGLYTVISHRSGETNDSFIADLAVGSNAGQIKAGGLSRGERLAKYNRLLEIEDKLIESAL